MFSLALVQSETKKPNQMHSRNVTVSLTSGQITVRVNSSRFLSRSRAAFAAIRLFRIAEKFVKLFGVDLPSTSAINSPCGDISAD
jgi:hypothetical protein